MKKKKERRALKSSTAGPFSITMSNTMKVTTTATVGAVLLSGNTMSPTREKVLAIVGWDKLTKKERGFFSRFEGPEAGHVTLDRRLTLEQLAAREYVITARRGRREASSRELFEATRYATVEAMVEAYR